MIKPRPLIGVLEDDAAVRDSVRLMLERNAYAVHTFSTPNEFLLSPGRDRYDCLIVDVGLPGMSGIELLELLRSRGNEVPAVVIAAASSAQLSERASAARVSMFLLKPMAPAHLLDALGKALASSAPTYGVAPT